MASGNEDLIQNYVDRTGFANDTKFVLGELNTIFAAYTKLSEIKVGFGNVQGLAGIGLLAKEATAQVEKITTATAKLSDEQKKQGASSANLYKSYKELLQQLSQIDAEKGKVIKDMESLAASFESGAISAEQYGDQISDLKLDLGKLNVSSSLVEKALKNIEKGAQASEGSLNKLRAELALAKQAFDAMSDSEKASATGQELISKIEQLGNAIKDLPKSDIDISFPNKDQLLDSIKSITDATRNQINTDQDLLQTAAKIEIAQKALAKSKKDLEIANKAGTITNEQYVAQLAEVIEGQTALTVSSQQVNLALKNIEKGAQSSDGSLNQLRAELNLATQAFDSLSSAEKEASTGQDLKAKIVSISDAVSKQEQDTKRFGRNVGNYAESLANGFERVREEISKLKIKQAELQNLSKNNPIGFKIGGGDDELNRTNAALQQLEKTAQIGFKTNQSYAVSVKQIEKAYQDFAVSGNVSEEFLQDFKKFAAQAKDEASDLKQEIKSLSSDTRQLDLAASTVSVLASGFEAAAGAAALFGGNTEDVQRITQKLVAIQSVANGIREVATQITTKGTAANKAYNFVIQQGSVLFGKASTAAQRFGVALNSIAVIAIAGILFELAKKLDIFSSSSDKAAESVDKLTASLESQRKSVAILSEEADFEGALSVERLKQQGADKSKIFEEEQKIRKENYRRQLRTIRQGNKDIAAVQAELSNLPTNVSFGDRFVAGERERLKGQLDALKKNTLEVSQEAIRSRRAIDLAASQEQTRIVEDSKDGNKKRGDDTKKRTEEERKAELELFKFRQGIIKELNAPIADTALFSVKKRVEASENIARVEKNIVIAQSDFDLKQAGLTANKIIEIRKKLSEAVTNEDIIRTEKEFGLSNTQVLLFEKEADAKIKIEQDLRSKIDTIQFSSRAKFLQDNEKLLEEANEIADRLNSEQFARDQKQIDNLKKNLDERISVQKVSADNAEAALNEQYSKGLINKEEFENEKKKIEARLLKESLLAQIDYYEKLLQLQQATGIDTTESIEALARLKKELSGLKIDGVTNKFQENAKEIEEFLGKVLDIYGKVNSIISGVLDAATTRKKNRIQDEIDLLEEKKAKEIEMVEQTTASKEDAADRIAIVEARAASQKLILERRQRDLDIRRAQFEKAANIARIAIEGALAVVHQLASGEWVTAIPRAIVAGAMAAAQLAIAIATPIPKFKEGKKVNNNYQGPAVVGDGGRSELIVRKDGSTEVTPDRPTLTWIGKDDIIHPDINKLADTSIRIAKISTDKVLANGPGITNVIDFAPLTKAFERKIDELKTTIKNKTENHWHSENSMKLLLKKTGDGWTKPL